MTTDNQAEKDALWELHDAVENAEFRRDELKAIAETYGMVSSTITTRLEKRDRLGVVPSRDGLGLPTKLPSYEELQEAIKAFDDARERLQDALRGAVALGIAPRWNLDQEVP